MKNFREIIEGRAAEVASQYTSGNPIVSCIKTGFNPLDKMMVCERGILTTVMGHPGEGKSSVFRLLVEGAARGGYRPIVFPFEDPLDKIADAYLCKQMSVSPVDLRNGKVKDAPKRLLASVDELWWAENVIVCDEKMSSAEISRYLDSEVNPETGLVVLDYFQAMDAEADESSVERVISRLAWYLLDLAKRTNIASVGFSQVKAQVLERGKQAYDRIVFNIQRRNEEFSPEPWMVEAFRPVGGDAQWASGIYQRSKDVISLFRPNRWLREMGNSEFQDNIAEFMKVKANYSETHKVVRVGWDGPQSSFYELKKKGNGE